MKRLCLMALSLLMLSFNAFAQVNVAENDSDSKWFILTDVQLEAGKWNFIGFGSATTIEYALAEASPAISGENKLWALSYDYQNESWDGNYLNNNSTIQVGDGVFVWVENNTTIGIRPEGGEVQISRTIYPFKNPTIMNEPDVDNVWVELSNPYATDMSFDAFCQNLSIVVPNPPRFGFHTSLNETVYTYDGTSWSNPDAIAPGQGFFIDLWCTAVPKYVQNGIDISFSLSEEWTNQSKSKASRDFLTVSVSTDGYKVPVRFAQNDRAEDGFDICDARKKFGSGSVAEPYLVCNGINLCKEEVNSENYTATMNIKSFESRSVEIVADNIPEGYSLTLLDGAVEVEMSEGDVYTTDITEGENAERFKLLITKNNVSIADVAEAESIRVVNNNRSIRVYGGKSVRTEVYNALGQKVYETSDRAFDLNNVASGAYVLRVQDGKSVNSAKIVVE